jgi:hypothetical protein
MPQKLFHPEEIENLEVRACYDFEHQEARDKRNVWIKRTCLICHEERWIKVHWARKSARQNRLSGYCHKCTVSTAGSRNKGIPRRGKIWKGGRITTDQGYVRIKAPIDHPNKRAYGYILEHRLIMEKAIGRYLRPDETVHHKNGNRSDNRIENLELWNITQPSGKRIEDLLAWAKNIINLYGG